MSWHIETNSMGKVVLICNDKGHPVARMVDDKDHASAALIAAAPDLLKALKAARSMLAICAGPIPSNDERDAIAWADAAIAKAGGANG